MVGCKVLFSSKHEPLAMRQSYTMTGIRISTKRIVSVFNKGSILTPKALILLL